MKLSVLSKAGKAEGEIELNRPEVSPTLLRDWYERARANARTGTAHTKLRNEVSGGGKKPWRQKGTGRARQGSTRAPHWRKGGVVFGPRNERDYSQEMPQQKRRTAAQLMFSDLAESGRLVVHTGLGDTLKTKEAVATLKALGVDELHRVVVIVDNMYADNLRGFRNLAGVALENATRLDPRLLASARKVVVSKDVLEALFAAEGGSRASA